jgi:hypothetical protein
MAQDPSVRRAGARTFSRLAVLGSATAVALALGAMLAAAQQGLRVAQARDHGEDATHYIISGTVTNETRRDALDVYVTAEALDSGKKVVASGISFVTATLPAGATAPFTAKVPKMPGATTFRAMATGFRFGFGAQTP